MSDSSENFIAKISMAFVKRFRVTLLMFFAVLGIGFFSYTTLLVREGLPDITTPLVFVQVGYQAGDPNVVDEQITQPMEKLLKQVEGVEQVDTNTAPGYASAVVYFDNDYESEDASEIIQGEFDKSLEIPEQAQLQILPFKPTFDGKHDFLVALTDDKSIEEMQMAAQDIADELDKLDAVEEANSIDQINEVFNPKTGENVELQTTFNRIGQKEEDGDKIEFSKSILVGAVKAEGYSDRELSDQIRNEIDTLREDSELGGLEAVYIADLAEDVDNQISSLESNALSALLAVVLVLLLFVNWRSAVVTAVFIPTVMAATFIALLLIGYSLNIMVLFGLILVLGLFVDDAIVVVETIDYHKRNGMKGLDAVREGINAIGVADVMGTLTTIIAFMPMVLISGILGEFIRPIPITVIVSLIVSLAIALTVIPFLGYIIIPNKIEKKTRGVYALVDVFLNGFNRGVIGVGERVAKFIKLYTSKWYLTGLVVLVSFVLIGIGVSFAGQLKFSVFPPQKDSDGLSITITYPNGSDIQTKEGIASEVEVILSENYADFIDEVNYQFVGINQFGQDQALLDVGLVPMGDRDVTSVEISEGIKERVSEIEGARITAGEYQAGPPAEEYSYKMQIYAEEQEVLATVSTEVAEFIEDEIELDSGVEILDARVDYLDGIAKRDAQRYVEVTAKIDDPTNSGALIDIDDEIEAEYDDGRLEEFGLSADAFEYDKGMESENLEAFESAGVALVVAMILIYGLLVVQFDSFLQPLLIFLAFPFSFPGLFPGLYITDNALSFFVMVGVIALVGIVVNNTIMLLDFTKQYAESGSGIQESIVEAIRIRFRPLVTTSVTTVVGLLPLALTDPLWESIAFSIVFGLISSTLMVIFVFPAYYVVIENVRKGLKGLFGRLIPAA
ncbi:MMPL family transporter [Candidatus Dojkabacteria bacterium]|nr:MMPL family transporter [Candidatus Dojkabacteria bacterium]